MQFANGIFHECKTELNQIEAHRANSNGNGWVLNCRNSFLLNASYPIMRSSDWRATGQSNLADRIEHCSTIMHSS